MEADQQIRAAAAQAAATLMTSARPNVCCAESKDTQLSTQPKDAQPSTFLPGPGDFIAMAEVIEVYIRRGKYAAFALTQPMDEAASAPPVPEPRPEPVPLPPPVAVPPQPEPVVEDAIPADIRGDVPPKQAHALRFVEGQKKKRVDSIMERLSLAKALLHRQKLADEVEENNLSDFPVVVDGKTITLGEHFDSLLGRKVES